METSRPGSRIRAAAMLSSSARLVGFLPCACDRTTVSLRRPARCSPFPAAPLVEVASLMGCSFLVGVDLALDESLGLFPVVGQELVIAGHVHERARVAAVHLEEPPGAVAIDV